MKAKRKKYIPNQDLFIEEKIQLTYSLDQQETNDAYINHLKSIKQICEEFLSWFKGTST